MRKSLHCCAKLGNALPDTPGDQVNRTQDSLCGEEQNRDRPDRAPERVGKSARNRERILHRYGSPPYEQGHADYTGADGGTAYGDGPKCSFVTIRRTLHRGVVHANANAHP